VLNDGSYFVGNGGVSGAIDAEASNKFFHVAVGLEQAKISAVNRKWRGGSAECGSVLWKNKQIIIKLVRQWYRCVTRLRFWPPYLRWNVNHKSGNSVTVGGGGEGRTRG
jgi:hypothetical protein